MSNKQKFDPVKSLMDAFQGDVDDNELQVNYNRFVRDLSDLKEKHNELVPLINSNLDKINSLKEAIFTQAINGIIATEAIQRLKEIETENESHVSKIQLYSESINKTASLIEKYEDWSNRKLFTWWKAIRAVDPNTLPWLEWKTSYEDKII